MRESVIIAKHVSNVKWTSNDIQKKKTGIRSSTNYDMASLVLVIALNGT